MVTLTKDTLVPLSLVGIMFSGLVAGYMWKDDVDDSIQALGHVYELHALEMDARMARVLDKLGELERTMGDRWTRSDMREYNDALKALNEGVGFRSPEIR